MSRVVMAWCLVVAMCLMLSVVIFADSGASVPGAETEMADEADEDDEADVREDPELDNDESRLRAEALSYQKYPFINILDNKIERNGADWSALCERFDLCDDTVISIVHIGDSHIQAEGSTSRTRELLQREYGNAGRGLIIPFKLAGTNQPFDYGISSRSAFVEARLLKHPWPIDMGFTGIALQPRQRRFDFTLRLDEDGEGYAPDFNIIKVYGHGSPMYLLSAENAQGYPALCNFTAVGDTLSVFLFEPVSEITLNFESDGPCEIFGFKLENQMVGVEYSAIGNNGATYSTYNAIGSLGSDLRALSPNLVIVSLGANEAFGKVSDATFYDNIDVMVRDLQRHNPEAQILLVTPSECQRSSTRWVGKGRRRHKEKTYSINQNIERLRNVILRYGREQGIATYDWYQVAGGHGSSEQWLAHNLLGRDRIHHTWTGYGLQGELMYHALKRAVDENGSAQE